MKAVMTGDTLPNELDLLNLVLVGPLPHWIIENGDRPRHMTTTTTTTTTTRRPVDPELGRVTFVSGRSAPCFKTAFLCLKVQNKNLFLCSVFFLGIYYVESVYVNHVHVKCKFNK